MRHAARPGAHSVFDASSHRSPLTLFQNQPLSPTLRPCRLKRDGIAMLDQRRNLVLACALSALAGYVDGIGFLHLGGLFVSFMSGNSTRLGVALAEAHWPNVLQAIGLISLFVAGAASGSLIILTRASYC